MDGRTIASAKGFYVLFPKYSQRYLTLNIRREKSYFMRLKFKSQKLHSLIKWDQIMPIL
jgi:hypothetical protein